jgi:hypothetical protein
MTVYGRIMEAGLLIEHRHNDGSWNRFEPTPNHDAAAHDPEREWAKGKVIYSCTNCDEMVRVEDPGRERGEEAV